MNTISEPRPPAPGRRPWLLAGLALGAALLPLGSCLQGPWDYYPDDPPPTYGITAQAYAIADRPLDHVCFEKLLRLDEEPTDAYAFYDSADVRITGRFRDGLRTLALAPVDTSPNCFRGDTAAVILRGEAYDLAAVFAWDSAGTRTIHTLRSTAKVPTSFTIRDSANAPRLALTGGVPSDVFSLEFLAALPPNVREPLLAEFGDSLGAYAADSAALNGYLARKGPEIQKRLVELLQDDEITYAKGARLFYLNGILNTASHFYGSIRSPDVAAVLITHRFDPNTGTPSSVFTDLFGKPDTSDFYFRGDQRRLRLYGAFRLPNGENQLDNLGVVNVWFHTGLNRLYFYGFEQAYYDFITTAQEGEGDARIDPIYNVRGGRGFFAGAVADSFYVNIEADNLTTVYPMADAHAASCREEGWFSNGDCRSFYRPHCLEKAWQDRDCRPDAIRADLETGLRPDSTLDLAAALKSADVLDSARADTAAVRAGTLQFCIENGFPEAGNACGNFRAACLEGPGYNECKAGLWGFCKDARWKPAQCGSALVSYCADKPGRSDVLCRNAAAYCREHPEDPQCR